MVIGSGFDVASVGAPGNERLPDLPMFLPKTPINAQKYARAASMGATFDSSKNSHKPL
ncbi:hypothetical protein [Dyella sp. S184]|uniref:hypothetical protein n=1 Tax=Dyella sp. S184 TaxID=1641862 RepID=UPI00131AEF72|nr:hypothetical protein [Dyella sp. S184]